MLQALWHTWRPRLHGVVASGVATGARTREEATPTLLMVAEVAVVVVLQTVSVCVYVAVLVSRNPVPRSLPPSLLLTTGKLSLKEFGVLYFWLNSNQKARDRLVNRLTKKFPDIMAMQDEALLG